MVVRKTVTLKLSDELDLILQAHLHAHPHLTPAKVATTALIDYFKPILNEHTTRVLKEQKQREQDEERAQKQRALDDARAQKQRALDEERERKQRELDAAIARAEEERQAEAIAADAKHISKIHLLAVKARCFYDQEGKVLTFESEMMRVEYYFSTHKECRTALEEEAVRRKGRNIKRKLLAADYKGKEPDESCLERFAEIYGWAYDAHGRLTSPSGTDFAFPHPEEGMFIIMRYFFPDISPRRRIVGEW